MPPPGDPGHRRARSIVCALLLGSGWLAGCGDQPTAPETGVIPADAPAAHPAGATDPAAIAALLVADFLGSEPARVQVLDATAEVFPDASLGCPEPDMLYAQVLTPGWRVLAEAEGRRFDVRVAGGGGRICHRKSLPAPAARDLDTAAERAARLARTDLALRTGATADAVRVISGWPIQAGREPAGCAIDCAAGAADCGILVELELDERRYRYHVANDTARSCSEISPD